jgi:hypothetical protein
MQQILVRKYVEMDSILANMNVMMIIQLMVMAVIVVVW